VFVRSRQTHKTLPPIHRLQSQYEENNRDIRIR